MIGSPSINNFKKLSMGEGGSRRYSCPVCGQGVVTVRDNVFYGECDYCKATVIDYQPLPHQEAFHASSAQYRLNIGGFGSGKTTASCAEIAAHCLSIPDARVLITAPILSQVKDAVLPELEKFLPPKFLQQRILKPTPFYKLTNGSEILVYASDDQQKLRSLNLTGFYIEEGSGVEYEVFDQLMTRLRNKAGIVKDELGNEIGYRYMGIVSTNPEDGWVKDHFLLVSDVIRASKSIDLQVYKNLINKANLNRHFHTFISSTRDNMYVPAQFIERMSAGKPARWIRKYIDCYLDFREGAVYPEYKDCLVEPFDIPKSWKRIAGFDPGYNDPTAFPMGAIDPKDGTIYIYSDYKEAEKPMGYHADHIRESLKDVELLHPIQADPSVAKRNDRDGISYSDYMRRNYNIRLEAGNNELLVGIERVRDYMYAGKLKFFNSLVFLKDEFDKYTYPQNKKVNTNDVPVDKNNHLLDALRYMIMRLPPSPLEFGKEIVSIEGFFSFTGERKKTNVINPFKKDVNSRKTTVLGGLAKL